MRTTTIAALAFGLSLAGAPAFAADYGQGRDNNQPAADQQQDQNDQGDRHRRDKGDKGQKDQTPPSAMHKSDYNTNRGDGDNDRRGDRDRDRSNDNNYNNYNNNYNNYNNNTTYRDRDSTYRYRDRDRRGFNWTQYRRNFQSPRRFRIGIYHAPRGYYYRRWHYGERLPIAFYARDYWLLDYIAFGLFAPPPGCVWVRYGDDALLIDTETGEIIQVRYDVFYS
jgi:Ni/Co efflux regulator RcnB